MGRAAHADLSGYVGAGFGRELTHTGGPVRRQTSPAVGGRFAAGQAAVYLEGFMDGYNSALSERGYTKGFAADRPHGPYRSGWRDGYHISARDERRRR